MAKDELAELIFIPVPIMGHLRPTVEIAQRLVSRDPSRISATILIIKLSFPNGAIDAYIQSLISQNPTTVNVIELPLPDSQLSDPTCEDSWSIYLDSYKPVVKQFLLNRYDSSSSSSLTTDNRKRHLVGLVLDFLCTNFIEVGDELRVPSYCLTTSGAAFLTLSLYFEALHQDVPATFGAGSLEETVVEVAGFKYPIPMKVWPAMFLGKDSIVTFKSTMEYASKVRRTKGIIVNTFLELESSQIQSLTDGDHQVVPRIYPVGPIVNMKDHDYDSRNSTSEVILRWLDLQPPCSVVFLCFGSWGSFTKEQVKEIAVGIERSGQRFLWSLRRPVSVSPSDGQQKGDVNNGVNWFSSSPVPLPEEYEDYADVLPEGFLDRTAGVGRVIGWAPQMAVLGHKAVGVFVSHCGWNSILESLWFGVPMLTWPIYAEQQLNAFVLVKEMELALEIRMDYWCDTIKRVANMVVTAEEVEMGIRRMMVEEEGENIRRKVKEVSELGRKSVMGDGDSGGSSWESMGQFLKDVFRNLVES